MQESDIGAVMEVEKLCYEFPWTEGIFRDCLRVGYCSWIYRLDQRLIGYGVMSIAVGEAHILNICIHPEVQGQGLARRLLQRLLKLARRHNADTVFLEVRVSNQAALKLYDSIGFNEIGQRHNYYPAKDGREDAILLAMGL